MVYTTKRTIVYRVADEAEALKLREYLITHEHGTLASFSYDQKYNKKTDEEWVKVKATFDIDDEKEPEGVQKINLLEEEEF